MPDTTSETFVKGRAGSYTLAAYDAPPRAGGTTRVAFRQSHPPAANARLRLGRG